MKHILTFSMLCMILVACNKQTEKMTSSGIPIIPITCKNNQILNLSEFVDSIEIIPLETRDECLIGWIPKIISTKEYYLLISAIGYDFQKLYVFDKKRNFVRQISTRGQGGDEFYEVRDFDVISDSIIKMADAYATRTYNMEGKMLSSKRTTSRGQMELIHLEGNTFVYEGGAVSQDANNLLYALDNTDTRLDEFLEVPSLAAHISRYFGMQNSLTKDDKSIYFNHPFSNYIYRINPSTFEYKIAYQIDYGNKNFTWDMFDENGKIEDWSDYRKKQNNIMALSELQSIGDYFLFSSSMATSDEPYSGCISLYSTKTGKILTGHQIKDDMFFKGNQIKLKPRPGGTLTRHGNDEDHLLWVLNPEILLKGYDAYKEILGESKWKLFRQKFPRLVEVCEQLDEDSNPILLKIKLKEF